MLWNNCTWCGAPIQTNQVTRSDPYPHLCASCVSKVQSMGSKSVDPDDEFDITDEELALCNDFSDFEEDLLWDPAPGLDKPGCECGAIKAGTPWHARWCPIFQEPMK